MANFLDIAEIVGAMQLDGTITPIVPASNIFDNIPAEAPDSSYIIVDGAVSQTNKICNKTNRVSIRIMSGNKDSGTFGSLRSIYSAVNNFLIGDNKIFGNISVYLVEEANYIESTDELGKNTIINDYFFNYVK